MIPFSSRGRAPAEADEALARDCLTDYRARLDAMRHDLLALAKGGTKGEAQGTKEEGEATKDVGEDLVDRIFRAAHTVRGAVFLGLPKIGEIARKMEEAMAVFRCAGTAPRPHQVGILLRATERLIELIENSGASNNADIGRTIAALEMLEKSNPAAATPPDRADDGNRLRVLVAEDDVSTLLLLKNFLGRYGDCDVAANGVQAVEKFHASRSQGRKYDLVCMDLLMPNMGGREAVRQLRALEAQSPGSGPCSKIVIMTAVEDMAEVIGCFADFTDAYLMKPINLVGLLRYLKSWHLVP